MSGRGGQREFHFRTWGGKREGAGRRPSGTRAGVCHLRRPELLARHPVHVTLRVHPAIGRLRRRAVYRVVRRALTTSIIKRRGSMRVCHISIQGNHLHLLIEADDRAALSRGMQGFEISCARQLNRLIGNGTGGARRGRVFVDRYHAEILDGPRRVRHALAYVLNNWRRHREDVGNRARLDPYSSAAAFAGWADGAFLIRLTPSTELLPVWFPRTWLLSEGWRRGGRLISPSERPGPA